MCPCDCEARRPHAQTENEDENHPGSASLLMHAPFGPSAWPISIRAWWEPYHFARRSLCLIS